MALLQPSAPVAPQNQAPIQQAAPAQQDWVEAPFHQEANVQQFTTPQGYVAPNQGAVDPTYQQAPPLQVHQQDQAYQAQPVQQPIHNPPVQVQQNTQVAHTQNAAVGRAPAPDLAEAGFGGLEIGARSFPIIALKTDGLFEDTDGGAYGKGFTCRLISSRPKTAVQGVKTTNGKPDEQVFFTYDGVTTTSGRSVAETEAAFLAEGRVLSRREYTDVLVTMEDASQPYDQELRILSVAPTSRERLSGAIMALAIRNGWTTEGLMNNLGGYVLHVECGPKVTNAVQPFYPWKFSFQK